MQETTIQAIDIDRRIRLLTVTSALCIGGAERVAGCLTERVERRWFEAAACYLKECGPVGEHMKLAGVEVVPIPGLSLGRRDYLTSAKLRRLIRARRIQVIHTHDIHSLVDGAICRLVTPGLRHVHTFHYGNYPQRDKTQ